MCRPEGARRKKIQSTLPSCITILLRRAVAGKSNWPARFPAEKEIFPLSKPGGRNLYLFFFFFTRRSFVVLRPICFFFYHIERSRRSQYRISFKKGAGKGDFLDPGRVFLNYVIFFCFPSNEQFFHQKYYFDQKHDKKTVLQHSAFFFSPQVPLIMGEITRIFTQLRFSVIFNWFFFFLLEFRQK